MKQRKIHILGLLTALLGGILFLPKQVSAKYDPSDITQMSAYRFWAEVNELNPEMKDKDYIICGTSVCDPEGNESKNIKPQRCVVKQTSSRADHITSLTDGAKQAGFASQGVAIGLGATGAGAPVAVGVSVAGGVAYAVGTTIQVVRGRGEVTTFEYKCIDTTKPLDPGWAEAPEGGWVLRRKVRVGGWFDTTKEKGTCFGGSDGGSYCLAARNGIATVNYNKADTAFRGCEVLPVKLYNGRKCFFCPLFTVVYKVAGEMTAISFEALAAGFALVMAMGLAIWIAVQTLSHVSSLTKQDAPKFLMGLIKQSYKVMIAFVLLQLSSQIFIYGVVPVLSTGLEFGDALLDERYTAIKVSPGLSDMDKMEEVNPGILKRMSTLTNTDYYNSELYLKLDNFVVSLQRNISFMQGVGGSLVCIGTNALMFKGDDVRFRDGFVITIQGVLLAGFGFLLSIAFAFYLVDAVVQMGIAGALMPFLIACWPFKLTSKYANTGWSMLLNSAFVFAFTGLVLSVNLNLVDAALRFTAVEAQSQEETVEDGEGQAVNVGGLYRIAQAINSQDEAELVRLTDMSTVGFLILLFCCIFGFKFLGRASELAGKFAGGALKPIAPSIGTMAGSATKSFALKSTQATREAAWEKVKDGGRFMASLPGRAFRAAANGGKKGDKAGGTANGGAGAGGAGGSAESGGGDASEASENNEAFDNENNATPQENNDNTVRVSENNSAKPQSVRPQAASTGQFNPKNNSAAPVATARLSEASSGGKENVQKEGAPVRENTSASDAREENKVEKAHYSGKRKQGGKAKNNSQKGRSRKYKQNRSRRRK